jgi:hypothetical protein
MEGNAAGKLSGNGRKVTWDLSSAVEGVYTAEVEVNDGNQHTAFASTKVTIAACSSCDPPPPPCPIVSVSCPDIVDPKPPMIFEAKVIGGDPKMEPTFTWTLSTGKIISGQGTAKIMVDVSTFVIEPITARVSVGGADPSCSRTTATCTTPLASPQP